MKKLTICIDTPNLETDSNNTIAISESFERLQEFAYNHASEAPANFPVLHDEVFDNDTLTLEGYGKTITYLISPVMVV